MRLDEKGSAIWELCDGEHEVAEICKLMEERYHEEMEPVIPRTLQFLERLLRRGLVRLESGSK